MKKPILLLWLLLMTAPLLMASQMYVIGEQFTVTWCPSCPAARSALRQMYDQPDNFPYLIPLIWQGDGPHVSPSFSARFNTLYQGQYVPHTQWGGTIPVIGSNYTAFVNAYNQTANLISPMEIDIDLTINAQDQMVINATANMTGDITTTNNRILFILTYDLTGVMDPDYFASVKRYHQQDFPLTSQGQSQSFSHAFDLDASWDIYNIKAVVIVQSLVTGNAPIHQAAVADFTGMSAIYSSNVQQGPPNLHVQFYNQSMPAGDIISWEWDLNGDGTIDSTEENPSYIYTEVGSYDVTLTVSDGTDIATQTVESFITVTTPDNASGSVSGTWLTDHSPYIIVDDLLIAEGSYLIIEPGVEIISGNSSITIEGYIHADAGDEAPIVFASNEDWLGMRINDSELENIFNNCFFSNASQTALIIENSMVDIIGCTFYNNSGGTNPGALKISNTDDIVLTNNTFANNQSTNGIGVVEIISGNFSMSNNLLVNNTGHIASSIGLRSGSAIIFTNNTVANNEYLSDNGFHIFVHNSFMQVRNAIIRGEEPIVSGFSGAITLIEYSNVTGGLSGIGNIDTDPLFEEPTEGDGIEFDGLAAVWYLSDGSPCIDAGNPATMYNDPEDPANTGYALFPAKGTVVNDMGTFGGSGTEYWVSTDGDIYIVQPVSGDRIVAYPNPFNPDVNISLSNINYPSSQPVTLKIYNSRGQLIRMIIDNIVTDKTEFVWNGLDDNNRSVPSGVYFIGFSSKDLNVSQKVLLLK